MANTQTISDMDIINDDVFQLLGFQNPTDDQRRELMTLILEIVRNRVIARLYDSLEETERDTVEELFSNKNYDGVNVILAEKGLPDVVTLVAQEALYYKAELVQKFNPQSAA